MGKVPTELSEFRVTTKKILYAKVAIDVSYLTLTETQRHRVFFLNNLLQLPVKKTIDQELTTDNYVPEPFSDTL